METSVNSSNTEMCPHFKVKIIITTWVLVYTLCVPIFMLVLFVGYRKWTRGGSGNLSHSDVFTFNIIAMEMCAAVGSALVLRGFFIGEVVEAGTSLINLNSVGHIFFQSFTCVDRYLAVVHPVTYLGLKKRGRVMIRNISIGLVWLLVIGQDFLKYIIRIFYKQVLSILFTFLALAVVTFCSISVLCVLIRPKPGEMGGGRQRIDQSKRRAFYTMLVILGALMMRLMSDMFYSIVKLMMVDKIDSCILYLSTLWFGLPCSLVLPLLFLHRAGTVKACIKRCNM